MGVFHATGADWRGDHAHVPFQVPLFMAAGNAGVAAVASAAVGAEMWAVSKVTRTRIDLSQGRQFRLMCVPTALGNAATAGIRMGYMTTNAATWAGTDLGAAAHSLVVGAGTAGTVYDTGWLAIATAAQVDGLYVACQVSVAFGTTAPSFGNIECYFR